MSVSGDCFNVTVTITPQPLVLRANQSDTGGMVSVVCVTSGLHTGDRVVLMSIRRTADDVTSHLVSASQNEKAASLESTSGLTGATATGGITIPPNASTVNLTLTQARCYQDEGNYTCSVSVLKRQANTLSRMSDQENLTITGKALTCLLVLAGFLTLSAPCDVYVSRVPLLFNS